MTELFNQRYYKVNKFLLSVIGQWPYQSRARRHTFLVLFLILFASQLIPQFLAVAENSDDLDVILEAISPFVIDVACGTKLVNIVVNYNEMLNLADRMKFDWQSLVNEPEMRVLEDYAEIGRRFTIAYATGVYAVTALFLTQPVIPQILEALNVIDRAPPLIYPFPVDYYGIDFEKYYYYMLTHTIIVVGLIVTVIVAADTMFIAQMQHACGMFKVAGYQMERMAESLSDNRESHLPPTTDPMFRKLTDCIKIHRQAIEFADILESSYCWSFFSTAGVNVIVMSVTMFQTVVKMDENPEEAVRYGAFTIAQMSHFFFQSFFSQRLQDHSEEVRDYMYQAKWYRTSLCSQKLLNLITMRTYRPCQMTAGKIMVMSLPNFTSVVKTSMSYFTLLRSMQ